MGSRINMKGGGRKPCSEVKPPSLGFSQIDFWFQGFMSRDNMLVDAGVRHLRAPLVSRDLG